MPSKKPYFNTRLTPEGISLVELLLQHYGISQSAVIEILVRDRARELGLGMYSPARKPEKSK
jgi:hypothetical protein